MTHWLTSSFHVAWKYLNKTYHPKMKNHSLVELQTHTVVVDKSQNYKKEILVNSVLQLCFKFCL